MPRSSWKVPFVSNVFFSNFFLNKKVFYLWKRNSIISSFFLNKKFRIYNGIWQLTLNIKSGMIGHKFGEFSITKRLGREIHFNKKK